MICIKCETMYPSNYDKCPKCKATESKQTEYKINKRPKNEDTYEPISAMVVGSEITQGDADYQY